MKYRTRKMVFQRDLNPSGTLFGGRAMEWIDEEAAIYAACQLGTSSIVTAAFSKLVFMSPAHLGDAVEIGTQVIKFGRTSITISVSMRNKTTGKEIINVDEIVFVAVKDGVPTPHGVTEEKDDGA